MNKRMGRPEKLSKEVTQKVCDALRGGNHRQTAARYAGLGWGTFTRYMMLGKEKPRSRFGTFRQKVLEAETAAEVRCVALVMKAAITDVKAAQWWLARRHDVKWNEASRLDVSSRTEVNAKVSVEVASVRRLSSERLQQIVDLASELPAGTDGAH
jgi:hypothetical protein